MVRNYQKVKTLDEALRRLQTQRAARPRAPLPSHPAPTARHPALVSRKPQRDSGGSRVPQQRPAGVPACKSENPSGNTESRGYRFFTVAGGRSEQPSGARLAAVRGRHQRQIAHERGRRAGSGLMIHGLSQPNGHAQIGDTGSQRPGSDHRNSPPTFRHLPIWRAGRRSGE
jgi:hypothetical protein